MPWLSRLGAPPASPRTHANFTRDAARRTIELLESASGRNPVAALLIHLDNDFQKLRDCLPRCWPAATNGCGTCGQGGDPAEARAAFEAALRNVIRDGMEGARALPG